MCEGRSGACFLAAHVKTHQREMMARRVVSGPLVLASYHWPSYLRVSPACIKTVPVTASAAIGISWHSPGDHRNCRSCGRTCNRRLGQTRRRCAPGHVARHPEANWD